MAFFDDVHLTRPAALASRAVQGLKALWDTPFDRRNRRLAARVAQLRALDDAQLARIGLSRDEIIPHVFGNKRRRPRWR